MSEWFDLLPEFRVLVEEAGPSGVRATVRDFDDTTYIVTTSDFRTWSCGCGAENLCDHLLAVKAVSDRGIPLDDDNERNE